MRLTVPRKLKAIIMGAPGSGKGTIAGRITSNYPQMEHKSSGDLLRGQIEKGTGIAKEAQIYMNEGKVKIKMKFIFLILSLRDNACHTSVFF